MIAPDANLLIYAHQTTSPFHRKARAWLEDILSSTVPVGLPSLSVYAFLRFMTNPKLQKSPLNFAQASALVDSWLAVPQCHILYPGERHWQILRDLSGQVRLYGSHITDAAIAATAIEYGAVVHTNDRDFARFPGLRWQNPLEDSAPHRGRP